MADATSGPSPSHRRSFLAGALTGAAAGVIGAATTGVLQRSLGAAPSSSAGRRRVEWRLASSFPGALDTIYGAGETLARCVSQMTDGAFSIRCYQSGELVPGMQVLDAVQKGSAEVGHTGGYYYTGKNAALAFDSCVPFGLTSRQQLAWLHEGGGLELMRSIYADFGIVNFVGGCTGAQMGGWFREPVDTAADLAGLRMRIPGLGGKVMDRLGVSVQQLSGGDIYPALERGAIDATEFVGPYDDEKLGFWRVAKNYYYPGWWEPGPTLSFLVSRVAWDALPADYQAIFAAAAQQASAAMQARYDKENPPALERLLAKGVQLRPFSAEIMAAASRESEALMEEQASQDETYRRILEHWRSFRKASQRWFSSAEFAYQQFAYR
jgi:TRAP-type mannitol/chloroaromatic compound transport system substrate-binding protein